ncbi:MAG TPA: LytTR family DNA-binding domain-containing protein [Lachnospiraceae bacterium]|nr:LytTR family DNA-binding domain-containing protein [Lachnospiraceae bacterium]
MIKLNLFCDKAIEENRVDVFYSEMNPIIQRIVDAANSEQPVLKSRDEEDIKYIDIKDIFYLDCVDKKVFAYTETHVYPLEETLVHYEDVLADYGFVRISKSNIVNIFKIKAIKSEINMRIGATFANGEKLYINRNYKKSFIDFLTRMRGCIDER